MEKVQVKSPTGEVLEAKDTELPTLVQNGYQIPDKEYQFQGDDGKKYAVPASEFSKAVQSGWKFRDAATVKDEELEKKYGDQTLKALLYGGARGVTFGLSDLALEKSGISTQEELKEIKDRNAVASVIGDTLGTITPAVLSGGTGLIAKVAAKTPAALASKTALNLGAKAASKVAAENTVKQGLARAAAAGATEGFLVGEGQLISEAALGDADFNAESLMVHGGTGALMGGGLGVLGQLGVDAFKKSATKAREYLKGAVSKMDDKQASKAMLEKLGLEEKAAEALQQINPENDALQAWKNLGSEMPDYVVNPDPASQQIGGYLQKQSTTLGGRLAQRDIEKGYQQLETIGNAFLKDAKEVAASDLGSAAKSSMINKIDEELALPKALYSEFEEVAAEVPLTNQIRKVFRTRVSELPYSKLEPQKAKGFADIFDSLETVKDLKRYRTIIGNEIKAAVRAGDINKIEFLDDLYNTATRARDRAIEANYKGKPFVSRSGQVIDLKESIKLADEMYSKANKQYSYLEKITGRKNKSISGLKRELESMSDEKLAKNLFKMDDLETMGKFRNDFPELYDTAKAKFLGEIKASSQSNGKFSPIKFANSLSKLDDKQLQFLYPGVKNPKQLISHFGKAARSLPKDINPSGTSTALFLSEMMNPTAYMAKQTGDLAAYLLWSKGDKGVIKYIKDTALPLANIQRASERISSKVNSSGRGFVDAVGRMARSGAIKSMETSDKQLERAKNIYEKVQADPYELQQLLEKNNQKLMVAAPATNAAYQNRMIAGVNFLASKIPKQAEEYMGYKYQPSDSEVMKFNEYLAGVEQPLKVLEKMKEGYASPRSLEAIKVVYPKIYDKLQQSVIASLSKKKDITNLQRVRLQELLGINLTPALNANSMALLQGPTPSEQPQAVKSSSNVQNLGASRRNQSGLDRVVNRS